MSNVIYFNGVTRLDLPTNDVLEHAKDQVIDGGVMVIGYNEEGQMYFASSLADGGDCLWLLEHAKDALLWPGR